MTFLAMTLKRMGRDGEASDALAQAEKLLAEPIGSRSGAKWWDLDICEIGLKEARELFGRTERK